MLFPYSESIEQAMKRVFTQLSEQGRRLYAAVEAQKLPRGGQHYIAELLGCTPKTIRRGTYELATPASLPAAGRIRHPAADGNGCWTNCPNWMRNSRRCCRSIPRAIR